MKVRAAESKLEHFITLTKKSFFCYKNELHLWGNPLFFNNKNCLSFRVRDFICKQRLGFQEVIWPSCYSTSTKSQHSVIFLTDTPPPEMYWTVWYKRCCSHSGRLKLKWQKSPIRIIWAWSFLTHIREHARVNAQIAAEEHKLRDATWIQTLYWLPKQNRFGLVCRHRIPTQP